VKCLILKLFRAARPFTIASEKLEKKSQPCKLRYHLLGQLSFWILLGFTGKALCTSIPDEKLSIESQQQKFGRDEAGLQTKKLSLENQQQKFGADQTRSQTDKVTMQFPIERSATLIYSVSAKDLAPISLSEETINLAQKLPVNRFDTLPSLTGRMSTTPRRRLPKSFIVPRLPSNRCWRSTVRCSYNSDASLVVTIPPPKDRIDPEIGDLRLSPIPQSELGELNIQPIAVDPPVGAGDPELGTLRLQERTNPQPPIALPTRPRQRSAFLSVRADYFKSSNVFSDVDPQDDGLFRTGLTFFYAPPIGPRTFLITSIDANIIRYNRLDVSYDELRLRAGIFHRITPRLSGEIGWSNQRLSNSRGDLRRLFNGERFFRDNSIRLELSRQDQLAPRLTLNTFYQFRWSIAEPSEIDPRSRILNSFIATLGYNFSSKLQTAIDYQFTWSHFTQQPRDDLYHQLVARVSYNLTQRTQVNVFSGFSFGSSSDRRIDFNSFIFGAGLVFNLPLF
jgi:hypothetical protein